MPLRVTLTTPERRLLDAVEAEAVTVPAFDGEVGILPGHAAFLALLGTGELRVRAGGAERRFVIDQGFLEVYSDAVTLLAERALERDEVGPAQEEGEAVLSFTAVEDPQREKAWVKAKEKIRDTS